jgi:hypothetical protein
MICLIVCRLQCMVSGVSTLLVTSGAHMQGLLVACGRGLCRVAGGRTREAHMLCFVLCLVIRVPPWSPQQEQKGLTCATVASRCGDSDSGHPVKGRSWYPAGSLQLWQPPHKA